MGLISSFFRGVSQQFPKAGDLCTVDDGGGFYRVAKVLVVDTVGVHVRLYKNRWKERPKLVDTSLLSLGSIYEGDEVGIGHLPLTKKAFACWKPVVFGYQNVEKDELDGYEMWKDAGGYFGEP